MTLTWGSLLTCLFIGLKLTGFIDWSWWLVVLPTIIEVSVFGVLCLLATLVYFIGDKK